MKILVTGGAGFIGSHLCEALIKDGNEVVALDDLSTGNHTNLRSLEGQPKFIFVEGNILERKKIEEVISKVDGVMHFAAAVGVQKILKDPIGSLRTNLEGSENVLEVAARSNKPTLLASTSEIYGKNDAVSLSEDSDRILGSPLKSRWTYSEAKAIDEALARALFEINGWSVKIVRLFNTVGPRQSAAYGMVIPRFISSALKGHPLEIHGDGNQRRVFCHIEDAVSGILALWKSKTGAGEAFNVGGFEETTILDLAKRIITKTNSSSELKMIPYSQLSATGFEDMKRRVPNTSKLQALTGWSPSRNLDSILEDTIRELKSF